METVLQRLYRDLFNQVHGILQLQNQFTPSNNIQHVGKAPEFQQLTAS